MKILSPMSSGSGASVVHKTLQSHIPGYKVCSYTPILEYLPPLIPAVCKSEGVELIHATSDYGCLFRKVNRPLVITFHNFLLDRFMREYSTWAQKLHYRTDLLYLTKKTLKVANVVTAVSHFTADLVRSELGYQGNINVIYNGVDSERFIPGKRRQFGPITVLFCGNPTLRKTAGLLPAIARLLNKNIVIQYTSGLRGETYRFSSERLVSIGSIEHETMPAIYQQADMLLLPTVREGLPLAVIEAMASGLPVVATNCSSLPELVAHDKGGVLCDLGDAEQFASAINMLADSVESRRQMGAYNREKVEARFMLSQMTQAYKELFEQALNS